MSHKLHYKADVVQAPAASATGQSSNHKTWKLTFVTSLLHTRHLKGQNRNRLAWSQYYVSGWHKSATRYILQWASTSKIWFASEPVPEGHT